MHRRAVERAAKQFLERDHPVAVVGKRQKNDILFSLRLNG